MRGEPATLRNLSLDKVAQLCRDRVTASRHVRGLLPQTLWPELRRRIQSRLCRTLEKIFGRAHAPGVGTCGDPCADWCTSHDCARALIAREISDCELAEEELAYLEWLLASEK